MTKQSNHNTRWQCLGSRYLFDSPWYKVRQDRVRLPAGREIPYTLIEHPGYALIVPLLDDGCVVMERVYRYPLDRSLLECPSGGCGGEPPEQAARRELEEETGYRAKHMKQLGSFACSSGISDEICHVFLATGLAADGIQNREDTEQISLEHVPLAELHQIALGGAIEDALTSLAIVLAYATVMAKESRNDTANDQ